MVKKREIVIINCIDNVKSLRLLLNATVVFRQNWHYLLILLISSRNFSASAAAACAVGASV